MTASDLIQQYQTRGFVVHPLSRPDDKGNSPGKKPKLPNWQKLTATLPDIGKYMSQGCNWGVVCGKVSNITILDFDHLLFFEQVFYGLDLETLRSNRTEGRGHVYFKYNPSLPASKHHDLGIEVLSDGNNAVIPPSVHASGDVYKWSDPDAPIIEMPKALEDNLIKLFQTETELKQIIGKCRHCFRSILKDKKDLHGAEGREYMIAVCTDLKAAGAIDKHITMFARIIYGKDYDEARTLREWRNIDAAKTWKCETLKAKLPMYIDLIECDRCDKRKRTNSKKEYKPNQIDAKPLFKEELKHTDLGNAKRLINYHGGDIRFCYPWGKWFIYNGKYWNQDDTGGIFRLAKKTIACLYVEASKLDDKDRKYVVQFALSCESNHRLKSMVELAKSEPDIPILPAQLDYDPWVLNLNNGTAELKTGKFREHRREELITKCAPVDYDPDAKCPKWLSFLDKIFRGEKDLIKFMQKTVGYSLTGNTQEQCFFILYGHGKNGKTTFLQVIARLLGDYAMQTPADSLMVKKFDNGISNDIARLRGARFVSAVESGDGKRLHESLIKQITGGDKISARFLHAEFFEFTPECKIFLGTNHKPDIKGTDYAIWRRVRMIPFTVQIPEAERIADYHKILIEEELSGILNWALEGCKMWLVEGLGIPDEVKEATAEYKDEMDLLGDFLEACCEIDEEAIFPNKTLYAAYQLWSAAGQETSLTHISFSRSLEERGYRKEKKEHGRVWHGLRLKEKVLDIVSNSDGYNDGCRLMTDYMGFFNELSTYKNNLKTHHKPSDSDITVIPGKLVINYLSLNYNKIGKPDTPVGLDRLRDNMALNLEVDLGVDEESSRRYVTDYCRARGWV